MDDFHGAANVLRFSQIQHPVDRFNTQYQPAGVVSVQLCQRAAF